MNRERASLSSFALAGKSASVSWRNEEYLRYLPEKLLGKHPPSWAVKLFSMISAHSYKFIQATYNTNDVPDSDWTSADERV
jgi:hypothetical protein